MTVLKIHFNKSRNQNEMPHKRPKLSVDVQRKIFVECGHRCSVCGESFPLERAHIISWSESRDNNYENMICLCANCHEKADQFEWGEDVLRSYKKNPWVHRNYVGHKPTSEVAEFVITIRMKRSDFDKTHENWLKYGLAAFCDICPSDVEIRDVREGSVRVRVRVPREAAELIDISRNDKGILEYLKPLDVVGISSISTIHPEVLHRRRKMLTDLRLLVDSLQRFCDEYASELNQELRSLEKAATWLAMAAKQFHVQLSAEAEICENDEWLSATQGMSRMLVESLLRDANRKLGVRCGRVNSRRVRRANCDARLKATAVVVGIAIPKLQALIADGVDVLAVFEDTALEAKEEVT